MQFQRMRRQTKIMLLNVVNFMQLQVKKNLAYELELAQTKAAVATGVPLEVVKKILAVAKERNKRTETKQTVSVGVGTEENVYVCNKINKIEIHLLNETTETNVNVNKPESDEERAAGLDEVSLNVVMSDDENNETAPLSPPSDSDIYDRFSVYSDSNVTPSITEEVDSADII